ncbi:hypothetical protein LOD99_14925 [Oopsacas minuta]|uniref:CCR4-NOT transcription complex subunit 1 HEAT repeat domain-containing protein n=1 Tax=Oopsacas minuta TaxID=111878 RepID=A0AAV7KDB4_9METZ|nr:hypothetical protein LOD99_14925 [Oopsacas minuta]
MSSTNPLQFSFQRVRHTLVTVSKIPHSSQLLGQPLNNANIAIQNLQNEISHLISCHGYELECYLLKSLFCHSLETARDDRNVQKLANEDSQVYLLKIHLMSVYERHNFVSLISHSFQQACCQVFNPNSTLATLVVDKNALSNLNKVLKQSLLYSCILSLSLLSCDVISSQAEEVLHSCLPLITGDQSRQDWVHEVTPDVLQLILSYMLQTADLDSCMTSKEITEFIIFLQKELHSNQPYSLVLSPLIYQHSLDISIATLLEPAMSRISGVSELCDMILELGYSCTYSREDVVMLLQQLSILQLSAGCIAKVLGCMATHHRDLTEHVSLYPGIGLDTDRPHKDTGEDPQSWVLETFISVLKDLVPSLNWREVVLALDYPGFYLPDPDSLSVIMRAYRLATQDPFPIDALYRPWENREGQLSWLRQALSGYADFSFADYQFRRVTIEQTKYPPEDETKNILTWTSLDLIETLLSLAEGGLYDQVLPLFSSPMKHCSEILLLGLVQAKSQWNVIQLEILSVLLPTFLSTLPGPGSHAILSSVWHDPSPRAQGIMMHSLSDWYTRSVDPFDQSRLTRVLEIAQDMKSLVNLLNTGYPFHFAIELACLACRRDYLKLDIWLMEKTKIHRDMFVAACVQFIRSRVPTPLIADKIPHLSQDIVLTILSSINSHQTTLSSDVSEALQQLVSVFGPLPPRPRPHSISLPKQTDTGFPTGQLDLSGNIHNITLTTG